MAVAKRARLNERNGALTLFERQTDIAHQPELAMGVVRRLHNTLVQASFETWKEYRAFRKHCRAIMAGFLRRLQNSFINKRKRKSKEPSKRSKCATGGKPELQEESKTTVRRECMCDRRTICSQKI